MAVHRERARARLVAVNTSPDVLGIVREFLEGEGFAVATTTFGPGVFGRIAADQPDAALVDVAPGERAGWELLERLHGSPETAGIPVLVTSTSRLLLLRARAQPGRFGRRRTLEKPWRLEALLAAVEATVGPP